MKAISQGDNTYDIFDDSLKVYNQLPPQSYVVRFSERRGFFLEKYVDIKINEPIIYGSHNEKVKKVLNSFSEMNRSLGIILSGDKGTGKSLFAKLLAEKSVQNAMPVIIVDSYINGIASYIESIEQEVMILFDEFDKTFGEVKAQDGQTSPQSTLLSLFDGLSGGKKLYVITCNNLTKLSEYLINRPGRFHYHLRFGYPSAEEIRKYLEDKLVSDYYGEIDSVISFSGRVSLNYDCLRSIAFELNHGISFSEAIKDLNIINIEKEQYRVILKYENGLIATNNKAYIDMFEEESAEVYLFDNSGNNFVDVVFNPYNAIYDCNVGGYVVPPNKINTNYYSNESEESVKAAKASQIEQLVIMKKKSRELHYMV